MTWHKPTRSLLAATLRPLALGVLIGSFFLTGVIPIPIASMQSQQLWNADYTLEYDGARTSGDQLLDVVHTDWHDVWRFGILSDPNGSLATPTIRVDPNPGLGSLTPSTPPGTTLNAPNPPYIWVGPTLSPFSGSFTSLSSTVVPAPYTLGYTATRNLVGGRAVQAGATENRTLTVTVTPTDPALTDMGTTVNFLGFGPPGPVSVPSVSCTATDGSVQASLGQIHWQVGGGLNAPPLPSNIPHTLTCALMLVNSSPSRSLYTPSLTISGGRIAPSTQSVANSAIVDSSLSVNPVDPLGTVSYFVTPSGVGAIAQVTKHFVRTVHFDAVNQVDMATPTMTLTSSANPSAPGQTVTFTATLSGTAGTPTGTVTFTIDGSNPTTQNLNGSGQASFSTSTLTLGGHSIAAGYSGDGTYFSQSRSIGQSVNRLSPAMTLTSSVNPSAFGQNVTFTATVTGTAGPATGSVNFNVDGSPFTTQTLDGLGQAGFSINSLSSGPHTISSQYTGGAIHSMQNRSITQTVGPQSAPPFTQILEGPPGACICTPLLMNTFSTGTENWFVKADGSGQLALTVFAVSVNNTGPGTVNAKIFDPSGTQLLELSASYPSGTPSGTEASQSGTVVTTADTVYRVDITTPNSQFNPHYRLKFTGAREAGINSPSFASFEGQRARWLFNVASGESLNVRIFSQGTPQPPVGTSQSFTFQWVPPSGPPTAPQTLSATTPPGIDQQIPPPASVTPGVWTLILNASTHYRLEKTSGTDRGIYLNWLSGGEGSVRVNVLLNGAPFTGSVQLNHTGPENGTVTFAGGLLQVPSADVGAYQLQIVPPPGMIVTPASLDAVVTCDGLTEVTFTLIEFAPPASGQFVIGNLANRSVGASVYFWGSQWEKNNPTSAGTPPAGFKGFATGSTSPTCGGSWRSDPGNSSNPPSGVPAFMTVVVSSVQKSGSDIAGNIVSVLVVRTNPGYSSNPGHEGTGTVVAVLCQQ